MTKRASRQITHEATCNWQSKENRILLESRRSSGSLEIPSVSSSHKSKPGHEPGTRVERGIKAGGETNRSEGEKKINRKGRTEKTKEKKGRRRRKWRRKKRKEKREKNDNSKDTATGGQKLVNKERELARSGRLESRSRSSLACSLLGTSPRRRRRRLGRRLARSKGGLENSTKQRIDLVTEQLAGDRSNQKSGGSSCRGMRLICRQRRRNDSGWFEWVAVEGLGVVRGEDEKKEKQRQRQKEGESSNSVGEGTSGLGGHDRR